jgi:hypothetical protein
MRHQELLFGASVLGTEIALNGLSVRLDHRRRPGAIDRDRDVRRLPHRLRHRDLPGVMLHDHLIATALMPDYTGSDVSTEYDA